MEEDFSNCPEFINIPESNIRSIQSNIQAQLENFEIKIPDTTFLESSVCDNVRDYILNFDDEPHLSKTQNNCRRISIASELCTDICSLYSHIVDYEFKRIISDMIQWEKFKNLSRKISQKIQLEVKREKYFLKEAQDKLLITSGELKPTGISEQTPRPVEDIESVLGSRVGLEQRPRKDLEQMSISLGSSEETVRYKETRYDEGSPFLPVQYEPEDAGKVTAAEGMYERLASPCESTFMDDSISSITRIMTEMRAEPITDTSRLLYPISSIPRQDLSLPTTVAEISIAEPSIQRKTDDDVNEILRILEDQSFHKERVEVEKPKNLLEVTGHVTEASFEPLPHEKQIDASEKSGSEEWSLPSIEPTKKIRKRYSHLIIDEVTVIPEYAARALLLNRNVNIQRVQVYEGPPKVLQAISVNHLMSTPGFKNSVFQDIKNSKLSRLYSRHLEVQKRPVETKLLQERMIEKQKEVISKKKPSTDIVEEVVTRAGMRATLEKTDILIKAAPEKSHHEDLEVSALGVAPRGSVVGMPLSRIINATIEPLEEEQMERINATILPSPRAQNLQGKSLDPKTSSPSWFLYTKENPPKAKYREFNYVYEKLQNYWSLFESQGMERCVSLREFFSFEQNESNANFLTVLRILDKMSIQRKLVLEYKNHDVLIRPFESPYVSDRQLLLKGKELIF